MANCRLCSRNADDNTKDGYCILHSPKPDKDKNAFDSALANSHERNYSHIVFPPDTVFANNEFSYAVFAQATFLGKANFRDKVFNGWSDFQCAIFAGTADFSGATFTGEAKFSGAKFTQDAQFDEAKFESGAKFEDIVFPGGADFSDTRFGKESDFAGTTAQESEHSDLRRANFNGVTFERMANFSRAQFAYEGYFSRAEFTRGANFYRVVFTDKAKANFISAGFGEEVNFVGANFRRLAQFTEAEFRKGARFYSAIFTGPAAFDGASFLGKTLFVREVESNQARIFSGVKVYFRGVTIYPLDALTFRDADLTKCRFQGTDLRKAEITNARWPKRDKAVRLLGKLSWTYDEDLLFQRLQKKKCQKEISQEDKSSQFLHIEQLYCQLKQNYENRRDYERARDFHFGEKEMRRKNPKTSWGLKLLLGLYRLVAGYGESATRAFVSAVALLVACTVLYLCLGVRPKVASDLLALSDWSLALEYSFRVMTLLRPDELGLVAVGWAKVVYFFESIAGPVLLGLFGLALRQRLKRYRESLAFLGGWRSNGVGSKRLKGDASQALDYLNADAALTTEDFWYFPAKFHEALNLFLTQPHLVHSIFK
jgi:uncharacterized protein YjbI with pentapeptide repeats